MNGPMDFRLFTCWVLIERSVDIDGWVGHCLEFDIVSQGDSPQHALAMVKEATGICLLDDLNDGVDPESVRERAPTECWEALYELMKRGDRVPMKQIESGEAKVTRFAIQIVLPFFRQHQVELAPTAVNPMLEVYSSGSMQIAC
jgi:predicted RNase H-like HicB family nuclease